MTVCIRCGHLMVFDHSLIDGSLFMRDPTDEELDQMAGDKRIVAIMTAMSKLKEKIAREADHELE